MIFQFIFILIINVLFANGNTNINTLLTSIDYDSTVRPLTFDSQNQTIPLSITIQLTINSLSNIDSKFQTFDSGFFVREQWIDNRLIGLDLENTFITIKDATLLWSPDTFLVDATKKCDLNNQVLELDSLSGTVYRSRALWCTMSNELDLREFPLDQQQLHLRIQSYSLSSERLVLQWREDSPLDPLPSNWLSNSIWHVVDEETKIETKLFRRGQPFSIAVATVIVKRQATQYWLKFIFPMSLLVLLSSLQYYVPADSVPGRVAFALTILLVIITFNLLVSQELPRVGYGTLLDQFIITALSFTGVGVLEYAAISFLSSNWLSSTHRTRCLALAKSIEQFFRTAIFPSWIVVVLFFFSVPRPASYVLIVVGCVLFAALGAVRAQKVYRASSTPQPAPSPPPPPATAPVTVVCQCQSTSRRRAKKRDTQQQQQN